jgi:thiosulfate dehydrogenase [quinone] large subunit
LHRDHRAGGGGVKHHGSITAPLWPLALCRITIGILWLTALIWKLPPNFIPPEGLRSLKEWMQLEVQYPVVSIYGQFVQSIVLPNFTLFAWATFIVELLIGLGLLLGLFTRAAAVLGLLMSINLTIGLLDVPNEWPWSYIMLVMFQALFVFTDPGRVWGLDGWRAGR